MRSEAQISASRLNGAKSRGPRRKTAAPQPGLSARSVVLCNESHELFEQLERNFFNDLKPVDVIELFLIQRMAAAQWRIYRAYAIATALLNASLLQNWQQDEAENPGLDQDFRLALAYKRIAKDLVAVQQMEARMDRSLDRALTAFHRFRKFRSPNAQPIEPPLTGVTTTGRDPASYFSVECEPKPTPVEKPQTPPAQALAADPSKSAAVPEPKPKPKRRPTAKLETSMEFDKAYEPQKIEPRWAKCWLETGVFNADRDAPGPVFSLVVPPPNVTGSLHMGHMLDHSTIDTAVRWHRMRGDNTLFLPGVDHAGIATQMLVERSLAKEGISRKQIGREEFEKRVWAWKEKFGTRITEQMKRIGDSCDWSRERFTLSPELSRAVTEAFVVLYERDLIYRGEYMVNWCPSCQTAISDVEVKHEEIEGSLWHIRYPVEGSDRFLTVATTRPETMLGDTAVAVNPRDPRYRDLHGKTVELPLMNRSVPIVTDELADPKFGTGVVKITPAHDPNDFEVGKRHQLPSVKVIDEEGKMTAQAGPYAGLDRFAARKKVVADLEKLGLLEKVEPHRMAISKCDRCGTIVEPLVSTQWFVKTKPLAEKCIQAVDTGAVAFVPENWNKTFYHWMENIRDWCISRQLWWGHRIPAWHCDDCHKITVSRVAPKLCAHCSSLNLKQDPDVLDTWFSSSLWPFSTMGWPDATPDLAKYFPTSLLITGFDILFFWVARMMMMGLEITGKAPFAVVHMHGLVRDADKQKMSKTKGNVIDPLEINEKYGTDAVRLSLLIAVAPGTDIAYNEDRAAAAQKYANKIWNAARLIWMNMESCGVEPAIPDAGDAEHIEDRWIYSLLNRTAETVNRAFEQHRYHEAADALWHFFWHDFCDWYLEVKKYRFTANSGMTNDWRNLLNVFGTFLRLQHPLMPFLTEELWHRFGQPQSIALQAFPEPSSTDGAAEREFTVLQEMVVAARTLRTKEGVLNVQRRNKNIDLALVEKLAKVTLDEKQRPEKFEGASQSTADFDMWPSVTEFDATLVRQKHEKETANLIKLLANIDRQLQNEKFLQGAPPAVIEELRQKRADYSTQLQKVEQALDALR